MARSFGATTPSTAAASAATADTHRCTRSYSTGGGAGVVHKKRFYFPTTGNKVGLDNLSPIPGAHRKKRRVGRGRGSGRGKTATRGMNGQKSRSSGPRGPHFVGGATPWYRRLPKHGFTNNRNAKPLTQVRLDQIIEFVEMGRLRPNPLLAVGEDYAASARAMRDAADAAGTDAYGVPRAPLPLPCVTQRDLRECGLIPRTFKHGIKLTMGSLGFAGNDDNSEHKEKEQAPFGAVPNRRAGRGAGTKVPGEVDPDVAMPWPIHLEVQRASPGAVAAVEAAGGYVTCAWYGRVNRRTLLKPEKAGRGGRPFPRRARPPPKDLGRYTSYRKRGYLSPQVQLRNYRIAQQLAAVAAEAPAAVDVQLAADAAEDGVEYSGVWWDANAGRAVFGPSRDRAI